MLPSFHREVLTNLVGRRVSIVFPNDVSMEYKCTTQTPYDGYNLVTFVLTSIPSVEYSDSLCNYILRSIVLWMTHNECFVTHLHVCVLHGNNDSNVKSCEIPFVSFSHKETIAEYINELSTSRYYVNLSSITVQCGSILSVSVCT